MKTNTMARIDYNKEIWEGWTVGAFISELEQPLSWVMNGESWMRPLKTKAELKKWCMDNQPGYKKYIPEVVNHFAQKYGLK